MVAGRRVISWPLAVAGMVFSVLPDLDSIGFRFGISYASPWGHRGFSHSLVVALCCAAIAMPFSKGFKASPWVVFSFLAAAMASHGILDAMTNAGRGVAFFWPVSDERIFFGFRPIEASPISVQRFLSGRGLQVLESEFLWVWLPAVAVAVAGIWVRRAFRGTQR